MNNTIDEIVRRMNENECAHRINQDLFIEERKDYNCGSCLGHNTSCDTYKSSAELPFLEYVKIAIKQYETKNE